MRQPVDNDDREMAEGLSPAERGLEAALSRLHPEGAIGDVAAGAGAKAALVFRDRLMFRAGEAAGVEKSRAAATRQLWAWRGVAATLAVVNMAMFARIVAPKPTPQRVEYVQGEGPPAPSSSTRAAAEALESVKSLGPDRRPGIVKQISNEPAAGFMPDWIGVRGDYLSTRAAVLRWGVAALPSDRVDASRGQSAAGAKAPGLLDLSGEDERPAGAAAFGTAPAPFGRFKQLKQWFSHLNDGGRL